MRQLLLECSGYRVVGCTLLVKATHILNWSIESFSRSIKIDISRCLNLTLRVILSK